MTLLAHAGHWLVNLAYVIPLVALVVILIVGKIQDRRAEAEGRAVEPVAEDG